MAYNPAYVQCNIFVAALYHLSLGMPVRPQKVSYLGAYVVAVISLLSGAAVVHNIFKPDLVRFNEHLDVHLLSAHDLSCMLTMHEVFADNTARRS